MVKRKALGAGLEALLSDKQGTNNKKSVQKPPDNKNKSGQEIVKIPLEKISRNPNSAHGISRKLSKNSKSLQKSLEHL